MGFLQNLVALTVHFVLLHHRVMILLEHTVLRLVIVGTTKTV